MKIVVDTNIVFSGVLNGAGHIGRLLIYPAEFMELYSCDFWRVELAKHRKKLLKLTRLSETGLAELEHLVTANITFINEGLLPGKLLERTEDFLKDIDINDTPFVALAKHLDGTLRTGDLALYKGLKAKRFKQVITTAEPALLLDKAALR